MRHICVLGIVDSERGRAIAKDMLAWLEPKYEVIQVLHDGTRFEEPALVEAQTTSLIRQEPVLYLHTRGAYNVHKTTAPTHRMWRDQFGTEKTDRYFRLIDSTHPIVACPFTGSKGVTWYNGFVANPSAWKIVQIPAPSERMQYERLFVNSGIDVIGLLTNMPDNEQEDSVHAARLYLFSHYK